MKKIILKFDFEEDANAWMEWYRNGGGQEKSGFFIESSLSELYAKDKILTLVPDEWKDEEE